MKFKTLLPLILLTASSVSAAPRIVNANILQLTAQHDKYVTLTTFLNGAHHNIANIELSGFDQYCNESDTSILEVNGKAIWFNQGVVGFKCNYQPATDEAAKFLMNQLLYKNHLTIGSYSFNTKGYVSSIRKMAKMLNSVSDGE